MPLKQDRTAVSKRPAANVDIATKQHKVDGQTSVDHVRAAHRLAVNSVDDLAEKRWELVEGLSFFAECTNDGSSKFYIAQVLKCKEATAELPYACFRRYGQRADNGGFHGGQHRLDAKASLADAKQIFTNTFLSKTGKEWENRTSKILPRERDQKTIYTVVALADEANVAATLQETAAAKLTTKAATAARKAEAYAKIAAEVSDRKKLAAKQSTEAKKQQQQQINTKYDKLQAKLTSLGCASYHGKVVVDDDDASAAVRKVMATAVEEGVIATCCFCNLDFYCKITKNANEALLNHALEGCCAADDAFKKATGKTNNSNSEAFESFVRTKLGCFKKGSEQYNLAQSALLRVAKQPASAERIATCPFGVDGCDLVVIYDETAAYAKVNNQSKLSLARHRMQVHLGCCGKDNAELGDDDESDDEDAAAAAKQLKKTACSFIKLSDGTQIKRGVVPNAEQRKELRAIVEKQLVKDGLVDLSREEKRVIDVLAVQRAYPNDVPVLDYDVFAANGPATKEEIVLLHGDFDQLRRNAASLLLGDASAASGTTGKPVMVPTRTFRVPEVKLPGMPVTGAIPMVALEHVVALTLLRAFTRKNFASPLCNRVGDVICCYSGKPLLLLSAEAEAGDAVASLERLDFKHHHLKFDNCVLIDRALQQKRGNGRNGFHCPLAYKLCFHELLSDQVARTFDITATVEQLHAAAVAEAGGVAKLKQKVAKTAERLQVSPAWMFQLPTLASVAPSIRSTYKAWMEWRDDAQGMSRVTDLRDLKAAFNVGNAKAAKLGPKN